MWVRLTERGVDGARRFAAVGGSYLAAITVAYLVFPANPDPIEAPANLIWHFRIDSLAGNALLWLVLGTAFGYLGDHVQREPSTISAPRDRVAA
jgi:predicted cobalt transporter CbtA